MSVALIVIVIIVVTVIGVADATVGVVLVIAAAIAVIAVEYLLRAKSSSKCFPCKGQRSGSSPLGRKKGG